MQTIFWLSIFGTFVSLGIFALTVVNAHSPQNHTTAELLCVAFYGVASLYAWRYLIIGIICLIIAITI